MTDLHPDKLAERLRLHIESLEANGLGNTEPLSLDDLCELHDALARLERVTEELAHFVDIVDGTEQTGFDPHVEQMLMDATEVARKALNGERM